MFQRHVKSNRGSYTLNTAVKPNFIALESRELHNKCVTNALGFTRDVVDMAYMEKASFFYDFYGFGGIRSTPMTLTARQHAHSALIPYDAIRQFSLKLTLMVRLQTALTGSWRWGEVRKPRQRRTLINQVGFLVLPILEF